MGQNCSIIKNPQLLIYFEEFTKLGDLAVRIVIVLNSVNEIFFPVFFFLLLTEGWDVVISEIPKFYAPRAISFNFEEHFI